MRREVSAPTKIVLITAKQDKETSSATANHRGRQRFQCKTCKKTFNDRKGTLFYNRKTDEKDILECLALLAKGVLISSIHRAKGFKEDTILSFLREAAGHTEQVEAILLNEYRISQAEIDGLWTYVGRKREKKNE